MPRGISLNKYPTPYLCSIGSHCGHRYKSKSQCPRTKALLSSGWRAYCHEFVSNPLQEKKQNKLNKNRNSSFFFTETGTNREVYRCLFVSGGKNLHGVIEDSDSDVLPCNLVKSVQFLLLHLCHLSQMQSRCGKYEVTDEGACLRSSKGAKISF